MKIGKDIAIFSIKTLIIMNNTVLTNVDFNDTLNTGLKVLRVWFEDEYTKVDLGFLYSNKRKNSIIISDAILLSDNSEKKELQECIGIELNTEIQLKSIKDFRYFSLKFEPFDNVKEKLILSQSDSQGTKIEIPIKK